MGATPATTGRWSTGVGRRQCIVSAQASSVTVYLAVLVGVRTSTLSACVGELRESSTSHVVMTDTLTSH